MRKLLCTVFVAIMSVFILVNSFSAVNALSNRNNILLTSNSSNENSFALVLERFSPNSFSEHDFISSLSEISCEIPLKNADGENNSFVLMLGRLPENNVIELVLSENGSKKDISSHIDISSRVMYNNKFAFPILTLALSSGSEYTLSAKYSVSKEEYTDVCKFHTAKNQREDKKKDDDEHIAQMNSEPAPEILGMGIIMEREKSTAFDPKYTRLLYLSSEPIYIDGNRNNNHDFVVLSNSESFKKPVTLSKTAGNGTPSTYSLSGNISCSKVEYKRDRNEKICYTLIENVALLSGALYSIEGLSFKTLADTREFDIAVSNLNALMPEKEKLMPTSLMVFELLHSEVLYLNTYEDKYKISEMLYQYELDEITDEINKFLKLIKKNEEEVAKFAPLKKQNDANPKTGDSTDSVFFIFIGFASVTAILPLLFKKFFRILIFRTGHIFKVQMRS